MICWYLVFGKDIVLSETCQVQGKFQIKAVEKENGKIHGGVLEIGERVGMPVMTLILVRQVQVSGGRKTQMGEERQKERGRALHREWVAHGKPPAPAPTLPFPPVGPFPLLPPLSGALNISPQEPHSPAFILPPVFSTLPVPSQLSYAIHHLTSPHPPSIQNGTPPLSPSSCISGFGERGQCPPSHSGKSGCPLILLRLSALP